MKKTLALLIALLTLLLLCSCGDTTEDDGAATPPVNDGKTVWLNVYNWGEYISDGFEGCLDVNAEFEKYYLEKFGVKVKVNYTTYANNEDMRAKLQSGAGSYDIVVPSDYMIQTLIADGLLMEFDVTALENYGNLDEKFTGMYYDPDNKYSAAYSYGTVGLIYNVTMLNPDDMNEDGTLKDPSWALMWDEDYRGNVLQFNNPRDAFATAMFYAGLDINSTNQADWVKAQQMLIEQKPILQGYVNDEIFNKMTTDSAAISAYYAGDYITMTADNENLRFAYPKEGTNVFVDAMCIPKSSTHPEIAKEYINFMLSEEIATANALYIGYASPNKTVYNSEEYAEEMGEEAMEILYGEEATNCNVNYSFEPYYHAFTPELQSYIYDLWEGVKTSSTIELWVHITSIVIVVAVLGLASYSVYIKKRRSRFYRKRNVAK